MSGQHRTNGVACPECGDTAPFERFTDLGRCPHCSTALQTLLDAGRGTAQR